MIRRSLLRIRLETDRLLRGRPLIARAVSGYLELPAYADLIAWLGALLPDDLPALAASDLERIGAQPLPPSSESSAGLYQRALGRAHARRQAAGVAALVALGTSWSSEAADSLAPRFSGATQLLEQLAWRGPEALETVRDRAAPGEILALVELARGAFLGVISQLELAWPAPRHSEGAWRASPDDDSSSDSPALASTVPNALQRGRDAFPSPLTRSLSERALKEFS